MHHTLNKRDTYAKAIHEQKQLEEELSWGHTGTQEELPSPPDERRWPLVSVEIPEDVYIQFCGWLNRRVR